MELTLIEYKKNLITDKMFGLVLLANSIAPAAIIFFMISSLTSYFGTV